MRYFMDLWYGNYWNDLLNETILKDKSFSWNVYYVKEKQSWQEFKYDEKMFPEGI